MMAQLAVHPVWSDVRPPVLGFDSAIDACVDNDVHIRATCIAGHNWSMRNLYTQDNAYRTEAELAMDISWELAERGIERAHGPTVGAMSGVIVPSEELSSHIVLPFNNELWRNKDLPSDGVPLLPGEAFVASLGGCGVGIATGDGVCIASHIGRDSAIHRQALLTGVPSRDHFSVVDAMAEWAQRLGSHPSRMTFRCLFALPQEAFSHPLEGSPDAEYHKRMGEYAFSNFGERAARIERDAVYLDMYGLVCGQAERHGFTVDAAARRPLPFAGEFGHTRHPVEAMKLQRNLVIVHRLS